MKELWKDIPNYPGYEVSPLGKVRSWRIGGSHHRSRRKVPLVLKPTPNLNGYMMVSLCRDKKHRSYAVHRLVLVTFVGPRPNGYQCGHLNGVRTDNRLSNLRWVTAKENAEHRVIHGTQTHGEQHCASKLTQRQVDAIRKMEGTHVSAAKRFGVSPSTVSKIRLGLWWNGLGGHQERKRA